MFFIILSILCSTGVSQILKISNVRKISVESIFLINYMVAAGTAAAQADFSTLPSPDTAWGFSFFLAAMFLGFMFIGSFYIYRKAIDDLGISLSATISRLSAGLPLLGSMLFFKEMPILRQTIGMAIVFVAIPLASDKSDKDKRNRHLFWGLVLFLAFGISDFTLKVVQELWPLVNKGAFLLFVFLTSAITALVRMIRKKTPLAINAILPGIVLGLINLGSSFFLLKALGKLEAIVVYPVLAIGIILMGLVTGLLFWKEKLTPAHTIFIFIAIVAVLLIS